MPQALSHCRARSANKEIVSNFFGKLGAIYSKLNLLCKPMQVYNSDETGVTIVHKPGKVIAALGRRHVYSVTSAERGRTHTVLSCVSAAGFVLPPCIVYPRKRNVPENFIEGAVPGTLFSRSENGGVNSDVYLEWFEFLKNVPPTRPVLLIQDGHTSHMSIKLIELARSNDVHLLCLPSHTTHILQPLYVGVFKAFKTCFSKACSSYLAQHPGRVITNDMIASLVATASPSAFTPNNIMGAFRKTGIFPINPGAIDDKMSSPSEAFQHQKPMSEQEASASALDTAIDNTLFTAEQQQLYERRFQEGYDLRDHEYEAWLKITHPIDAGSEPRSESSLMSRSSNSTSSGKNCNPISHSVEASSSSSTSHSKNKYVVLTQNLCQIDAE